MNFTIRADYLKALSMFMAGPKDIRKYIHGVYISNGLAYATNGHTAARIEDFSISSDGGYIVSAETVKQLLSVKFGIIQVKEGICQFAGIVVKTQEGSFPAPQLKTLYERAEAEPDEMANYDPDYLVLFKRAGEALGIKKGECYIRVKQKGYSAPSIVLVGRGEFTGIIMPTRL